MAGRAGPVFTRMGLQPPAVQQHAVRLRSGLHQDPQRKWRRIGVESLLSRDGGERGDLRGGVRQMCQHCELVGNLWVSCLVTHGNSCCWVTSWGLGGWMLVVLVESFSPWHALDIKPVLLARFQHLGDYERVGFCCAVSVQTFQPSGLAARWLKLKACLWNWPN